MAAKTIHKGDLIVHPVRLRILMILAGRQMTTQQLRTALPDIAQATLYRHMALLCNAGIIEVVAELPVRGVVEKVYAVPEGAGLLSDAEFSALTREDIQRYFSVFVGSLLDQFRRYLHQESIDPIRDGIGFQTIPLHLTDEESGALRHDLLAVLAPAIANLPVPGRRRRLLSLITIPDPEDESQSET